jgi:SRSO17 transposase
LHHFIAAGVWDAAPVETELVVQAERLVGGSDAVLVTDDTAIPKKGTHSVGVAAQYASALGKTANCQTLVSLTLARGEVPVSFPKIISTRIDDAVRPGDEDTRPLDRSMQRRILL